MKLIWIFGYCFGVINFTYCSNCCSKNSRFLSPFSRSMGHAATKFVTSVSPSSTRKTFIEAGPFDGIVGFSQGGCLAGLLAAMQPRCSTSSNWLNIEMWKEPSARHDSNYQKPNLDQCDAIVCDCKIVPILPCLSSTQEVQSGCSPARNQKSDKSIKFNWVNTDR